MNEENFEGEVRQRQLRILEALLFASSEPLSLAEMAPYVGDGANLPVLIEELRALYSDRGVNLVRRGDRWAFRTAEDLGFLLRREEEETRPLSRAALETLAIIAYHQPATRAAHARPPAYTGQARHLWHDRRLSRPLWS